MEDYSDIVYYERTDETVDCFLKYEARNDYGPYFVNAYSSIPDLEYVTKGDKIIELIDDSFGTKQTFYVFAIDDGDFEFHHSIRCFKGTRLCTIYKSKDVVKKHKFPNRIDQGVDEFTKEPFIKATMFGGNKYGFSFGMFYVRIEYINNKHKLYVDYSSSRFKFTKYHTLHFLLDNGSVLSFRDFKKPVKYTNNSERGDYINMTTSSIMTNQDIQLLASHKVLKWNLTNDEGTILAEQGVPSILSMTDPLKEIHREVFQDFVATYLSLYDEIRGDEDYKVDDEAENEDRRQSSSTCYVYLMVDTTNNFHKIGISNNPKYREHTLQSDKPTIELLYAKEYPSRTIAEAFEAALHRVYANKRIRGEWFNLDASDIEEIKQTLK